MKKNKKLFSVIIVTIFMFSLTLGANAQFQSIQPLWTNTNSVALGISYSGNNAICTVSISGQPGTSSITNCTLQLRDSAGKLLASWSGMSATGDWLMVQKTTSGVSPGNTYTLSFSATVHRNGFGENISGSTNKKY